MTGNPLDFEAIGSRLGFRVTEDDERMLKLVWRGPRFPAFLSLGIALALLFISVPIVEAIQLRGFSGPASALWYFPLMNIVLFGIALYLISLRRTIVFEHDSHKATFTKRSLWRKADLTVSYSEITAIRLARDQVYSGFAVAGSSAAQTFPVPTLRLNTSDAQSVLIDRGSFRRLKPLGERLAEKLNKPFDIEPVPELGPLKAQLEIK